MPATGVNDRATGFKRSYDFLRHACLKPGKPLAKVMTVQLTWHFLKLIGHWHPRCSLFEAAMLYLCLTMKSRDQNLGGQLLRLCTSFVEVVPEPNWSLCIWRTRGPNTPCPSLISVWKELLAYYYLWKKLIVYWRKASSFYLFFVVLRVNSIETVYKFLLLCFLR